MEPPPLPPSPCRIRRANSTSGWKKALLQCGRNGTGGRWIGLALTTSFGFTPRGSVACRRPQTGRQYGSASREPACHACRDTRARPRRSEKRLQSSTRRAELAPLRSAAEQARLYECTRRSRQHLPEHSVTRPRRPERCWRPSTRRAELAPLPPAAEPRKGVQAQARLHECTRRKSPALAKVGLPSPCASQTGEEPDDCT